MKLETLKKTINIAFIINILISTGIFCAWKLLPSTSIIPTTLMMHFTLIACIAFFLFQIWRTISTEFLNALYDHQRISKHEKPIYEAYNISPQQIQTALNQSTSFRAIKAVVNSAFMICMLCTSLSITLNPNLQILLTLADIMLIAITASTLVDIALQFGAGKFNYKNDPYKTTKIITRIVATTAQIILGIANTLIYVAPISLPVISIAGLYIPIASISIIVFASLAGIGTYVNNITHEKLIPTPTTQLGSTATKPPDTHTEGQKIKSPKSILTTST